MNTIQIPTKIILFIISSTTFSIVYGEQSILYRNNANEKISANSFEIPIPFQSKFQMNHSFSLSTSIINGKSQTKGIYSNLTHYNFSDRFNMQMKLHFIQNQSKSTLPYPIQPKVGYEIGLEYKLSPNTVFSLAMVNNSNAFSHYKRSYLYAP